MLMKLDGSVSAKKPSLLRKTGRFLLAALLAFLVLEAFSRFYFNKPIHHATPDGPTDYVWEPHTFYSVWTEGIGWGRTNNEGFYNAGDWTDGDRADVLIMGSSFMMAEQVPQNRSTAALLGELLPQYRVYNIGMAAHGMLSCFQNLRSACEKYHPRYVVLDSQVLSFTDEELQLCLDGEFPEESSNDNPLLLFLKRSAFLNLLYYQASFYIEDHGGLFSPPELQRLFPAREPAIEDSAESSEETDEAVPAAEVTDNRTLLRRVLTRAAEVAAETDTEIIVVFQPKTWLDGYGGILIYDNSVEGDYDVFYESCGVHLLNMANIFRANYDAERVLPFGFCNSKVGAGHLNREGHRMIAEALAARIGELET